MTRNTFDRAEQVVGDAAAEEPGGHPDQHGQHRGGDPGDEAHDEHAAGADHELGEHDPDWPAEEGRADLAELGACIVSAVISLGS
jgi:hypothetical protein